jgi:hypothetical protein
LYDVTFDRDMSDCVYGATLTDFTNAGSDKEGMGELTAYADPVDTNAVAVVISRGDGTVISAGFSLLVSC